MSRLPLTLYLHSIVICIPHSLCGHRRYINFYIHSEPSEMLPLPALCVCVYVCVLYLCTRCHSWWQDHKSEYVLTARCTIVHKALHYITHRSLTHTCMHTPRGATPRGREQGRSGSLTFTYNLFMLHAVIQHTWEKVNFFSQWDGSSKAAADDFKITTCSSNILTCNVLLPPSGAADDRVALTQTAARHRQRPPRPTAGTAVPAGAASCFGWLNYWCWVGDIHPEKVTREWNMMLLSVLFLVHMISFYSLHQIYSHLTY